MRLLSVPATGNSLGDGTASRSRLGRLAQGLPLAALWLAVLIVAAPATAQRVTSGIVVFYPFEEGNGTVVHDRSGVGSPMDLDLEQATRWVPGQNGLVFEGGVARTPGIATKLITALQATNQSTFEVWAAPTDLPQTFLPYDASRLLALAFFPGTENFLLGTDDSELVAQLLTTAKDPETNLPNITTTTGPVAPPALAHILHTFDGTTERLYVNGIEIGTLAGSADYTTWGTNHEFMIGNDLNQLKRAFLGTVRLVAAYDRALTPAEVTQNFNAGANLPIPPHVHAGADRATPATPGGATDLLTLVGSAVDDGLPGALTTTWSKVSGPGTVVFGDASALQTTATFSADGIYELELSASDTGSVSTDRVTVVVNQTGSLTAATNTFPIHTTVDTATNPTLEILCPVAGSEAAQWMIATNAGFTTVVYDSGPTVNDPCSHVAEANLAGATEHHFSVRLRDSAGLWSAWSASTRFTTRASNRLVQISYQEGVNGYVGTADADIRGDYNDPTAVVPEWNQGAQDVLRIGARFDGSEVLRSLVRFDVSGLNSPYGVANAWIELTGWMHSSSEMFDAPVSVHEVLADWGEGVGVISLPQPGEVTWVSRTFPTPWTVPGAAGLGTDRSALPLAHTTPTNRMGQVVRISSDALVQALRSWVATPTSNHGLLLEADDEILLKNLQMAPKEHANPSFRPRLVVELRTDTSCTVNAQCDDGNFCNGVETCDLALGCQAGTPPVLDDGVACTMDICDEVNDLVLNTPSNAVCDNGTFCDGAETCDAVLDCQAAPPPTIDDGVVCTLDSCDETNDVVVNAPNNAVCDNGLFCDGSETCDPILDCQAGPPPTVDDGVTCTVDSCDEVGDVVVNAPNNAVCDNGLFCDGSETCDPLLDCQAGPPPTADDGVGCTDEICDEVGDVVNNVPNDASCDDSLLCNGAETCDPTLDCQLGTPGLGTLFRGDIVFADPRTSDPLRDSIIVAVDPVTGLQEPLSIGGLLVDPRDVEVEANRCVVVPDPVNQAVLRIDPLLYDALNPAANQVILAQGGNLQNPHGIALAPNGDIFVAEDTIPGTIHRIDPITGAQSIVAEYGNLKFSTRVTVDAAGLVYVPVNSGPSSPAVVKIDPNAYDPMDPFANQEIVASGGGFSDPWDLDFDVLGRLLLLNAGDWNVFRLDISAYNPLNPPANQELVAEGGAFYSMRGIAVEGSGTAVVSNEGVATSTAIRLDVDNFDFQNLPSNQTQLTVDDLLVNPRGADVVGIGLCGNGALDPGEACDDGNESDGDCCSAVCQFEAAASACAADACETGGTCDGAGSCTGATPVLCDDALFCNGAETCDPVLGCQSGTPPTIDDGVVCTDDSCDEVGDVVVNAPNNGLCDNGLFCDGTETCDALLDCQVGTPPNLDDGVACTVDSCNEVGDVVVHTPNNTLCDNGAFCDGSETCDALLDCQAGTPPTDDDGVDCTDEICDEVGDVIVHTPNDTLCDNGTFCDGAETCDALLDCQAGTPPTLDDGVACTDDSCDEVGDVVVNAPNDSLCDNGQFCDGDEICDPVLDCQAGAPPPIDDGVGCTNDSCDEVNDVVVNMPDDSQCQDVGGPCTAPMCDPVLGCTTVPVPGCTPEVPAMPIWGRALLVVLLALGGALAPRIYGVRRRGGDVSPK